MRHLILRLTLCVLTITQAQISPAWGQSGTKNNLTLEDVVDLVRGGFSEELIITRIRKNAKSFDLSAEELIELKKAGVSEQVIKFLLDPSQTYTPPAPIAPPSPSGPPVKPVSPAKQYPPDALASRVPPDPGVYLFRDDKPVRLELKVLLGTKQGAGLGKVLMKKGRIIAYVPGATAKLAIQEASPVLYLRVPDGKALEDFVLVALDRKSDRREIDAGPGPKQELNADAIRTYESSAVAPNLFRITPTPLKTGDYMLFQMGSAEPDKGTQGRGYEFAIAPSGTDKHN